MQRLELKVPPVVVFLVIGAAMWLVAKQVPQATVHIPRPLPVAIAFSLAAAWLGVKAILDFRRHGTTVHPHYPEKASTVVADGVYRYTRNPMYLALVVVLLAWAVRLGNLASFAGLPLFVAYMTRFQVKPEERILLSKFGAPYREYMGTVRRWI
ncbi:MAG: isoprenylcysteine carboxylmethyltransferase family protein [Gammaproteobacteria bacterium]|nr:isoprenylcysteine carboxylmethyltransferase family protein [Gammaproteobacteria bacterium]MBT8104901.1 isoprenylcysteine carboxylmethyltransferase family protein [Gammaproteobacteria bacterium]NNK24915.1 isoprenylcysteine carboxylmethyltransferase family protein [Woeseiaceae bacterium]